MAYEMKAGQGSAFPNENKKEDWHADFRGRIMLPDGRTYWMDVTNKKTKDGKPWVAVKIGNECQGQGQPVYSAAHKPFQPQDAHNSAKANAYQPTNPFGSSTGVPGFDDDVPF